MRRKFGVVCHVKHDKGYWFVLDEDVRRFCHVSHWSEIEMPKVGDTISFELGPARNGGPDECVKAKPAQAPGADALVSKIITTEIEGVKVVRTEAI